MAEALDDSLHLHTPRPQNVETLQFLYKTWALCPRPWAFNPKIDPRGPVPNKHVTIIHSTGLNERYEHMGLIHISKSLRSIDDLSH